MPRSLPFSLIVLTLLLGVAGCLPSSCQRQEPHALFPADSLSRRLAEQTPVDTMRLAWSTAGPDSAVLRYPRTVLFGPGERLYVSDVQRNTVFEFETDGAFVREVTSDSFSFPYLAGRRGDTLLVFNPSAGRIDALLDGTVTPYIDTPTDLPAPRRLLYATASPEALYIKALGTNRDGFIARLDAEGGIDTRTALPGPQWRHAGLLRPWGDSLISLSGFRPVVDVVGPGGALDTLALVGFDSPMLARSRAFVLGDLDEPPLLTASAAPAGDLLFVLNMRPGWLRIDAYDRAGQLRYRLVQDQPAFNQEYYPIDLAVRRQPDGRFDLAVVDVEPEPRLTLYHWTPPER